MTTGEIVEKDWVHDNLLVDRRDVAQTIRERAHSLVTSGHSQAQERVGVEGEQPVASAMGTWSP